MEKKCVICHILLDVLCAAPGCPGHRNERVGEKCAYCADSQQEAVLLLRNLAASLASSLGNFESDLDGEAYP